MRESMMLSQSPNCRAVASIHNFLRFSEGFSPNPPQFCKLPDTDAGKGGKAGGIGGVTDPNPHPLGNSLGGGGGGPEGGFGTNGSTIFDTTGSGTNLLTFGSGTVWNSATS